MTGKNCFPAAKESHGIIGHFFMGSNHVMKYFNVHFKLHVTGFFPLKQSILVMTVPMAVTVTQTASISDLAKIIVHVQQVMKEMELCAQVRFVFSYNCCWWGFVGADTLWFITGICGGKGRWKAS